MRNVGDPLSPALLGLRSVIAARISDEGRLIEGSAGFLALFPEAVDTTKSPFVADAFIHPTLSELLRHPATSERPAYTGLFTLGEREGNTRSLRGTVMRHPNGITLVAEYDVDELERLYVASIEQSRKLAQLQRELTAANRRYQQIAATDPLTGVANRRRLDQFMETEISRATRQGSELSVVACDIDHFKRYNDTYGHAMGDRVLIAFAGLLSHQVRATDLVARSGGEEFVIVLPHTKLDDGVLYAERIRKQITHLQIADAMEEITASFGVAEWQAGETASRVLNRADAALYRAKAAGRNCVMRLDVGEDIPE